MLEGGGISVRVSAEVRSGHAFAQVSPARTVPGLPGEAVGVESQFQKVRAGVYRAACGAATSWMRGGTVIPAWGRTISPAARRAVRSWLTRMNSSVLTRQRFALEYASNVTGYRSHSCSSYRLQNQIRRNADAIATSIVLEQGKTFAGIHFVCDQPELGLTSLTDAHGDVLRGLQVVESACGITSQLLGDKLEVSKDMDTVTRRLPLGVCASIAPFNFPAYVRLMIFVCGYS